MCHVFMYYNLCVNNMNVIINRQRFIVKFNFGYS